MMEMDSNSSDERSGFHSLGANYRPPSIEEVQALVPRDKVLGFIGHGGMGTFYRARQTRLDRLVAIKVLLVDPQSDAHLIEGFKREARAMAKLNHKHIIKIFDFGEANSKLFLIMEHVAGQTLELLNETRRFSLQESVSMLMQVCDALEYAHGQGVLHRNLRLANTMLDENGMVKVGDFGLARLIGEELFRRNLAGDNLAMGSLESVAPEQHDEDVEVDHRADIFSLGVMLYKLTAGELPEDEFVPPSKIKPSLDPLVDGIVTRCMQRDPDRRYQSISDVRAALDMLASK